MKRMRIVVLVLLLGTTQSLSVLSANASADTELEAFPAAADGMQRFVITLPSRPRSEENDRKVELVAGKEMLTDGVNTYRLGGVMQTRSLAGWGYTYYQLEAAGPAMSTLMAPPEGAEPVKQFVTVQPLLVRYNSRLPIVVYVPAGYEVRYRIWQASETLERAPQR